MPNPLHSHLSASFTPNLSLKWVLWNTETLVAVAENDWVKVKTAFPFTAVDNQQTPQRVVIDSNLHTYTSLCIHVHAFVDKNFWKLSFLWKQLEFGQGQRSWDSRAVTHG